MGDFIGAVLGMALVALQIVGSIGLLILGVRVVVSLF